MSQVNTGRLRAVMFSRFGTRSLCVRVADRVRCKACIPR